MVYFSYQPLFDYMYEHGITQDSLIAASVVGSGVFERMKHHENVETASLTRIANYLKINDISQIMKIVVVVKDSTIIHVQDCMRSNYYSEIKPRNERGQRNLLQRRKIRPKQ